MELPKETLDFFNGDELRARTFYEKYALRDEDGNVVEDTPDSMWARVAHEISSVEISDDKKLEWDEKFYNLLMDYKFIPGGRILFGAGQKRNSTLLNCYFIPIKEDSIEGIYDWNKEAARTYSYGGGVGTDISILRPKGDPVNNSAIKSTGAVSFMELMSTTTGTIGQSGRRGALMILIDVSHPDIFDFIDVKNDPSRTAVKFANISVKVTDEFMDAVIRDDDFDLEYGGKVYRTVKAKEIWDKLVDSAWRSAEPGLIFWETAEQYSPTQYGSMEIKGVNPCVTGDTRVYAGNGLIQIKDLVGQEDFKIAIDIRHKDTREGLCSKVWSNGVKSVFKLNTKEGYSLKLTKDHKVFTENRGLIPASDLVEDDKIQIFNTDGYFGSFGSKELGEILGYTVGDGWFSDRRASMGFWGEDRSMVPHMLKNVNSFLPNMKVKSVSVDSRNLKTIRSKRIADLFESIGVNKENKLIVPECVFRGTKDFQAGYIRGLYSADATVGNNKEKGINISLTSISKELIDAVQMLLLNFGIASKQYPGQPERLSEIKGKFYTCKESYRLIISKENVHRFKDEIAFLEGSPKNMTLNDALNLPMARGLYSEGFSVRFKSLDYIGAEEVFDLTEEVSHSFIANGLTISNCSEQPLEDYGCCCLGNVNLSAFVEPDGEINQTELEEALKHSVRFLDNVLTYNMNKHPLSQQVEASLMSRRIGVGFTGLGDMLIKMNMKYDTDSAIEFVDGLFSWIKEVVYNASVDLGIEKGTAPGYRNDHIFKSYFFDTIDGESNEKLLGRIQDNGLRNCCLLTVAPVGSGSILAGCSSGVEPIFARSYQRRSESLSQEFFTVYHPLVKNYMEENGITEESDLPDTFVVSHEIEADKRVLMQSAIQKHIDSAISSTINLPEDVSRETVGEIYMKAWESGCKGITVYREGSREGVLITEDKVDEKAMEEVVSKDKINNRTLPDRPRKLIGFTESVKTEKGTLYVTINSHEGVPVEVFVQIGKSGLTKTADAEALGRLISLSLRNGIDIADVVKQLEALSGDAAVYSSGELIKSVPDAVAKVLRRNFVNKSSENKGIDGMLSMPLINVPMKDLVGTKNWDCDDTSRCHYVVENGCTKCMACGWSKCD